MPAAVRDTRASMGSTRLAPKRSEESDRAAVIAGTAANTYSRTARRAGGEGLRALTAIVRRCQGTRTQLARSQPQALNRASRTPGSDSPTRADTVLDTRKQPSAPGHPRRMTHRITPPEVTRC